MCCYLISQLSNKLEKKANNFSANLAVIMKVISFFTPSPVNACLKAQFDTHLLKPVFKCTESWIRITIHLGETVPVVTCIKDNTEEKHHYAIIAQFTSFNTSQT